MRPGNLYYMLALVLALLSINSHIFFLDFTLIPTEDVEQSRTIQKYYTADPVGTTALFHFDKFAFGEVSNHSIPYWNPYTLLGLPFLAEYQWGIFYPPNYLRMLVNDNYWDLYSYAHILLLSIVIFFLSRKFYTDRRGSFVAAISVFSTGFFLSYLPTYTIINVIPWGFYLVLSMEGIIRNPDNKYSSLGVTIAAFSLGTAGHPTLVIFMAIGAILFVIFRVILERTSLAVLFRIFLMLIAGVFLAMPNIAPFIYYILGSEGSVVTLWWEQPPFYSLKNLVAFVFPYIYGSINDSAFPLITSGVQPNSWFIWGTPPILFLAVIGSFFAIFHRKISILSLALAGLVLTLWGFGVPPFSMISSVKLLARLNPNYVWSFPAVVLCVLAGYGVYQLRIAPIARLRSPIYIYLVLIVLTLLYIIHLGMGIEVNMLYAKEVQLALMYGLIPGFLWPLAIAAVLLVILGDIESKRISKSVRSKLTWVPIILAIGLSSVGYYPSGNSANHAVISIGSLLVFILFITVYLAVHRCNKHRGYTPNKNTFTYLIFIGAFSCTLNYFFPGLPNRYGASAEPDYIKMISKDRLNWRVYGMKGGFVANDLAPYHISTLNNQNALAPIELRQFFRNYLDSYQDTTMFYGIKYNTATDGDPLTQLYIHRRFWDYVGAKYLVFPLVDGLKRIELNRQLSGYELPSFNGSHPVPIPSISQTNLHDSGFLLRKIDCSSGPFNSFRIRLSTNGIVHTGLLLANIFDQGGELIGASYLNASKIQDNELHSISYDHYICEDANSVVTLGLGLKTDSPHALMTWYSDNNELIFSKGNTHENGFRQINQSDNLGRSIYDNSEASPRAYLAKKSEIVGDWRSAQVAFSKQQNLRDTAFVEKDIQCNSAEAIRDLSDSTFKDHAYVSKIQSSEIEVRAQVNQSAILVLVDTYLPGWIATVNDVEMPIFRVNGLFRGVCLPRAGDYQVSMKYRPPYWHIFIAFPIVGCMIIAFTLLPRLKSYFFR